MCFSTEMRDILPKQKVEASNDTLNWYLEDLLLAYKYDMEKEFYRDISALKPYLSEMAIASLLYIARHKISWKGGRK